MHAVIKTGGKQYPVKEKTIVDVELLDGEIGSTFEFNEVLFVSDGSKTHVGAPHVNGYKVVGEIIDCVSGPKIKSMKFKRSHNTRKKFGHRQHYTRVRITAVTSN